MRFKWTYTGAARVRLGSFLKAQGLSSIQLKRMKYRKGYVFVNHRQRTTDFRLRPGDVVLVQLAPEVPVDTVVPTLGPLDIVYEDPYLLVVNKPAGVASIPDAAKGNDSMANFVKAYLATSGAESTAIHVVTRLDRDTSGLMLFAKHGFVHSLLDRQLHSRDLVKRYLAFVQGAAALAPHGWLVLPLGRTQEFYMKRGVVLGGKPSVTEYRLLARSGQGSQVLVTLHTGRTHQIRVHFAAIGYPLFGDDLYGGSQALIGRQALHCATLDLWHPVLHTKLHLTAALPSDMVSLGDKLGMRKWEDVPIID